MKIVKLVMTLQVMWGAVDNDDAEGIYGHHPPLMVKWHHVAMILSSSNM